MVILTLMIVFIENVYFHSDEGFPDDELKEWESLDFHIIANANNLEF